MCGIAGITGNNISENIKKMLISIKHRGPDGSGVFVDNKVVYGNLEDIDIAEGNFGMGHNLLSIVGCNEFQPLINDNLVLICNGEIYNFRGLSKTYGFRCPEKSEPANMECSGPQNRRFCGIFRGLKKEFHEDFKTDSDCEIILTLIKRFHQGSLNKAVEKAMKYLDGDYAFAVYDGKNFAAVRDPVGVKPLYFGENKEDNIFAFASKRKALQNIGIENVKTLPPDSMIYNKKLLKLDNTGLKVQTSPDIMNLSKDALKKKLKNLLIKSVEKRVQGLSKVGILFSGGIDSTLLAKIADDLGVETILYTVGHKDSVDIKVSKETAEAMNLQLKTRNIGVEDVKKYLPLVLDAIEEFNIMKIGVGMPAYIASEMAHKDGLKVMLSGQGADELFGGYNRYLRLYEEKGELAREDLKEDILNLYHVNLQRDDAVTMANSVELRVPYLDLDIINTAINIPMKYKISGIEDKLRKCILREVAAELGVPAEIVNRPKKAAQYGSGIHKMLKKVLKGKKYKNKCF
ncbi:MAG: asparagine synthetase B [Methanobacterium sp.]|jgi:asparagine synthase (glutamine-hydrolysing)